MATQRQRKTPTQNGKTTAIASDPSPHTDLMSHLDDLKHELEHSQQNEKQLQTTIEHLQTQIEQHTSIVQTFESHLEQSNQIQAELKEAQHMALKLSEENKKLIAEKLQHAEELAQLRSQLKQAEQSGKTAYLQTELEHAQKDALKLAEANQKLLEENKQLANSNQKLSEEHQTFKTKPSESKLAPQSPPRTPLDDADLRSHQEILRKRQAAALAHPVFPNEPPPSTEQDSSWFD